MTNVPEDILKRRLPEWVELNRIANHLHAPGQLFNLGKSLDAKGRELPLLAVSFGNQDPRAPVLGLIGGVHGLERIGTQVVLSLLHSFHEMLAWDAVLQETLKHIRIFFVPMVNPLGIMNRTRANPQGVDLMRNAPIDADEKPTFLLGGHRISKHLPWYRGKLNTPMQIESQALFDFCKAQFFQSERVVTLDLHSGFGLQDRLWFPYAKSKKDFPHLPQMQALKKMFDQTHPNHFYKIEPQSLNYTTHGDLWDYVYQEYCAQVGKTTGVYLPLALEMGSWAWVKKNPLQIFSALGAFNPVQPHRVKRILRRHQTLFDFLIRALVANKAWAPDVEM